MTVATVHRFDDPWFVPTGFDGSAGQGARFSARISDRSPFFDGHFPGRPVVPGVAFLGLVEQAVRRVDPRGGEPGFGVTGLRRARFRKIVERGGEVIVELQPAQNGAWRFEVTMHGDSTCTGVVTCGPPAGLGAAGSFQGIDIVDEVDESATRTPEVLRKVPHAGRMLLIERLLRAEQGHCLTRAVVERSWPLVVDDRCSAVVLVEVLAQTASALIAWELLDDASSDGAGFLVGIPRAAFTGGPLPMGARLDAEITVRLRMDNYATFGGTVRDHGRKLAELEIQAIRP